MTYPFTPRSAQKLRVGDYWALRRTDGAFGFFVFVARWDNFSSAFVAALLDCVESMPKLEPEGNRIRLREAGHLHIKTFRETSSQVGGNIRSRLDADELRRATEEQQRESKVWGYKLPLAMVNGLTGTK